MASVAEIGPAELAYWSDLQGASEVYRSPFFRPEFARAVAAVRDVRVAVIEDAGAPAGFFCFEAGRAGRGLPPGRPFSDYHGPVLSPEAEVDARFLVRSCGLRSWSFDHLPAGIGGFADHVCSGAESPLLDLSAGFDAYLEARRAASDIRAARRKARKLAREVGPLRLVPDSDDGGRLDQLIAWKRMQYAETGVRDVLATAAARELLQRVHAARDARFAGVLSVLYAGDVVAALHLGLQSGAVWHSWFPVYNPELHRYSPGLILMLELARAAPAHGIDEIDLGKGEARYKQQLATGSVPLLEGWVATDRLTALGERARTSARTALRAAGVHRAVRRTLRRR